MINFVRWQIRHNYYGIGISQEAYVDRLLTKYGLDPANVAYTPLPTSADVSPAKANEEVFIKTDHAQYRCIIGELLYVSVRQDMRT